MKQLAINGGSPVRSTKLFYGRQWINDDDVAEVSKTLISDYLTCGPKVSEFEKKLCEYTGAKFAVAVGKVTVAMTTHPQAAYRLILGQEARLYYTKS